MQVQECTLRSLLDYGGCPALSRAITAATGQDDAGGLSYQQLLAVLRSLPITSYSGDLADACQSLLDAMRAGDASQAAVLAAELCGPLPSAWGVTSGTTGSTKLFPLTAKHVEHALQVAGRCAKLHLHKFPLREEASASENGDSTANTTTSSSSSSRKPPRHRMLSMAVSGPCEELPSGQLVGSITSVWFNMASRRRAAVDVDLEGRDMGCKPAQLLWAMASNPATRAGSKYYALWLCAAADPGLDQVTMLGDVFAGNLLTAIHVLQQSWQDVVADLAAGRANSPHMQDLAPAATELVNQWLSAADPAVLAASAQHIQQVMTSWHQQELTGGPQQTASPLLAQLMPRLCAVATTVTGSHGKYWPALQRLLPPDVGVLTRIYGGTEGVYGVSEQLLRPGPFDLTRNPTEQRYLLLPHANCFFEFLEVSTAAHVGQEEGAQGTAVCSTATTLDVVGQHACQQQQQQKKAPQTFTLDELQQGCSYEFLVTTCAGLCRFAVCDAVRVQQHILFDHQAWVILDDQAEGAADQHQGQHQGQQHGQQQHQGQGQASSVVRLPLVSIEGRTGMALNLIWEKYDEGQLLKALRETEQILSQQQQQQQDQQLSDKRSSGGQASLFPGLAEFVVYEAHEGVDSNNKHYAFIWELLQHNATNSSREAAKAAAKTAVVVAPGAEAAASCSPQDIAAWAAVLNTQLGKHNTVYASLLAAGQIGPASIHLVQPGSFAALKEAQVAARLISPSQFKMPTVVAASSWHASFLMQRLLLR